LVCAVALLLWWLFFSRAAWIERIGAIVLIAAGGFATRRVLDVSVASGAQGMLYLMLAMPVVCLALVAWAVATRRMSNGVRRAAMAAILFAACGSFALIRTGGLSGNFSNDLRWRWARNSEERLLAQAP